MHLSFEVLSAYQYLFGVQLDRTLACGGVTAAGAAAASAELALAVLRSAHWIHIPPAGEHSMWPFLMEAAVQNLQNSLRQT